MLHHCSLNFHKQHVEFYGDQDLSLIYVPIAASDVSKIHRQLVTKYISCMEFYFHFSFTNKSEYLQVLGYKNYEFPYVSLIFFFKLPFYFEYFSQPKHKTNCFMMILLVLPGGNAWQWPVHPNSEFCQTKFSILFLAAWNPEEFWYLCSCYYPSIWYSFTKVFPSQSISLRPHSFINCKRCC